MQFWRTLFVSTCCLSLAISLSAQNKSRGRGPLDLSPLHEVSNVTPGTMQPPLAAAFKEEVSTPMAESYILPGAISISSPQKKHRIHWWPMLEEEFFDITVSHVDRIMHEPFTRAELKGHVFQDWKTIVKNWEWSHWSDGDRLFTSYIAHSSQGNVAGWIYRNNDDDGGIEQNFRDPNYRRVLRNSFLVETAYAWHWKLGPFSEATIGHVGLHYDPKRHTNRSGVDDLVMDEVGGTVMMIGEDWLDKHVMRRYEASHHGRPSTDILRMLLGLNRTYANILSFRRPWYRPGRD